MNQNLSTNPTLLTISLLFFFNTLIFAQPQQAIIGSWTADSKQPKTDLVAFKKLSKNEINKVPVENKIYTYKNDNTYKIEQWVVENGKGIRKLKFIQSGNWKIKHLGETDFLEITFNDLDSQDQVEIKKVYEIRDLTKNKMTYKDISAKGYMK